MAVDWARIRERDKEIRLERPEMFDKPPEGLYGFEVNPDLTESELDDAFFWKDYMRGVWLVTGPPGSGKDVLVNMVAYKMKHFFGLTPILDYKPCAPFGYYEFFDTKLFVTEVQKIANAAKVQVHDSQNKDESYNLIEDMALKWAEDNRKLLRNSVLVLNEFPRYMEKRRPHKPITILLSHLFTIWRHLGILIIGVATRTDYLDQRAFKELSMEVRCTWLASMPDTFMAMLYPRKFVQATGVTEIIGMPTPLIIDIAKPRDMLNGLAWKDLFNTENDVALDVPRSLRREQ